MSRRGRSGPTISLFSFQDIITSVTAIVTVITLLLALELVNRKQSQAGDSSVVMAADLIKRLERADEELASLQTAASSTDDLVREVAATSPAELRNEIAKRESCIVELEREKKHLEQQHQMWQSKAQEKKVEQFDLEPLKAQLVALEQVTTELEQKQAEEKGENRIIFVLPRGSNKDGWIAEIEGQVITLAPMGRPCKSLVLTGTGMNLLGGSVTNNFSIWIDEQQLSSAYFLLLVRPAANSAFSDVHEMLQKRNISHGFDLVDPTKNILHPERGAAP